MERNANKDLDGIDWLIAELVVDRVGTIHDFLSTLMNRDSLSLGDAQQRLHNGLQVLARLGLVRWAFEPDYGNEPCVIPATFSEDDFERDWRRCTAIHPLRPCEVPDTDDPTIDINTTERLDELWEIYRRQKNAERGPEKGTVTGE